MKNIAFLLMVTTMFSKVLGFLREIVLSYFYGASNISDAFIISMTIPNVIFSFIGIGITTAYIPLYNEITSENSKIKGIDFSNSLLNLILVIIIIFILFILGFTRPVVKLFASGFENDTLNLAVQFTRISIFAMLFKGPFYIIKGYLEIKNRFNLPVLVTIPFNIIIILAIFLSDIYNIKYIAFGFVIAMLIKLILLIPFVKKEGFVYKLYIDIYDKYLKKMILLSFPVILGNSVNQINVLVDRTLASRISVGGISALTYANRLSIFIQSIFIVAIVTVIFPLLSKLIADNNIKKFKNYIIESINAINLIIIPSTLGMIIFAKPIIKMLFGRGAFGLDAINMTSMSLIFYSVGLIGYGLRDILSRAFYAMKDTKTPVINASIGMVLNIILNLIFSKYFGVAGLALATSTSAIITAIFMFVSLRLKIGNLEIKKILIPLSKFIFSSIIMSLIAKSVFEILLIYNFRQDVTLIVSILIGIIVYFLVISYLGVKEIEDIIISIKKKIFN